MDVSRAPVPDPGWYVQELVSTLTFADGCAWLVERWTVVARVPLDELLVELNLDGARRLASGVPEVGTEVTPGVVVISGGELTTDHWPPSSTGRPMLGIWLPRPLEENGRHDFGLSFAVPWFQELRRHVFIPAVRCRRLQLRVRFPPSDLPATVTRVAGGPSSGPAASSTPDLPVDNIGEVAVTFQNLRPGKSYGVAWSAVPFSARGRRAGSTARRSSTRIPRNGPGVRGCRDTGI